MTASPTFAPRSSAAHSFSQKGVGDHCSALPACRAFDSLRPSEYGIVAIADSDRVRDVGQHGVTVVARGSFCDSVRECSVIKPGAALDDRDRLRALSLSASPRSSSAIAALQHAGKVDADPRLPSSPAACSRDRRGRGRAAGAPAARRSRAPGPATARARTRRATARSSTRATVRRMRSPVTSRRPCSVDSGMSRRASRAAA